MHGSAFIKTRVLSVGMFVLLVTYAFMDQTSVDPLSDEKEFMRANPKMIWGEKTNFIMGKLEGNTVLPVPASLMVGVHAKDGEVVLSGKPLKVVHPVAIYLFTDCSNTVYIGIPPFQERILVALTDSNGVPVPKTKEGQALGQPLTLKPQTTWPKWAGKNRNPWGMVFPHAPFPIMEINSEPERSPSRYKLRFNPADYFVIENPGLYHLKLQFRVYVVDTNMFLRPVTLPTVTVPVRVESAEP